jgi:hypothetical protein
MGKVWVQAVGIFSYEKDGKMMMCYPGGWAEIGKQDARRLMAEGKCTIHRVDTKKVVQDLADCAVALRGDGLDATQSAVAQRYPGLPVVSGWNFHSRRMLFWETSAKVKAEFVMVGFGLLLKGWHVAAPLLDYDTLARDVGSDDDRWRTRQLLHDLRVPVYDSRLVFARRCPASLGLFAAWKEEKAEGGDEDLAFLRALQRVKPLVNALPPFWIG